MHAENLKVPQGAGWSTLVRSGGSHIFHTFVEILFFIQHTIEYKHPSSSNFISITDKVCIEESQSQTTNDHCAAQGLLTHRLQQEG